MASGRSFAFFDFDGTISTHDSFRDFLRFCHGSMRVLRGLSLLSPHLAAYVLGIISNHRAKERVFHHFFAGMTLAELEHLARRFAETHLPGMVRQQALERLRDHRRHGHRLYIVSASPRIYLEPWAEALGAEVIATDIEIRSGRITGRFASPNCFGPEKVRRIRLETDLNADDYVYAYGDSRGDREMLDLADEGFFKPFRTEPGTLKALSQ